MKYKAQNARMLTSDELLSILCKSAKLYSEYAETTLLFIFREKKSDSESTYNKVFYEIKKGLFETEKEIFADDLKILISK